MNLISNLPVDTSSILIFAVACVLLACGIFFSFKPLIPASGATFLALLAGNWSGIVPLSDKILIFWAIAAIMAVVLHLLLPRQVSMSPRGQGWLALGAMTGCVVGVAMATVTAIVISTVAGICFGALIYSRSASSAPLRSSHRKYINYLMAKGLPLAVNYSMTGIFVAVLTSLRNLTVIAFICLMGVSGLRAAAPAQHLTPKAERQNLGKPDLEAIKAAVNDENSPKYYPRLLEMFMKNDTVMTAEDYQYFYYGAIFQEDYNPYREPCYPEELEAVSKLYAKENTSRHERQLMLDYAIKALEDNPLNLRQLTNRVYVYHKNGKNDLAKIWQHKLNHLLLVIAASGTGESREEAWMVVYPGNEYDYLNLSGHTAIGQQFLEPCYDYISVSRRSDSDPEGYYFNINEMLKQYFAKHPSES